MTDKMMRVAGRNPSGVAKAIQTDASGYLKTVLSADTPDLLATYCRGTKISTVGGANTVVQFWYHLTSAVAGLPNDGELTLKQQVPSFGTADINALYRRWKIAIRNTTNQAAQIFIYPAGYYDDNNHYRIYESATQAGRLTIYEGAVDEFITERRAMFSSLGGGVSAPNVIAVPEMDGFYLDLVVRVKFATAPTSGNIYVAYEAQK